MILSFTDIHIDFVE